MGREHDNCGSGILPTVHAGIGEGHMSIMHACTTAQVTTRLTHLPAAP